MRGLFAILAGACLLLGALAARGGDTWYVSLAGTDGNFGMSRSNAWRTLQFAADVAAPGDTIVILAGTYVGARVEASGAPGAPITIRAETNGTVILNSVSEAHKRNCILEIETYSGDGVVSNVVVEGLTIAGSPNYGMRVQSTQGITLRNNTVHNSGSTGIFTPFCYDIVIEGNTCHDNGEHGIYHNNSSDRFVIRRNHCHHNTAAGLHFNGDLSVPPPDGTPWAGDGVLSDGLVEGNVIHENGTSGAGINMDGVTETIVRNNVLYATPNNSGIALYRVDAAVASRNNWIVNNVILMGQNSGWAINLSHTGCINNRILNNAVFHPQSGDGSIAIASPSLAGLVCDYNSVKDRFTANNDASRLDLAAWRRLGYDTHSIVATPAQLFVSHPLRDYRLKDGSPAIDRGTPVAEVPVDSDGQSRPLDGNADSTPAWDIGAFEYLHAAAHSDSDGMSDGDETVAGTDPADPDSVLRLMSVDTLDGQVVITWASASGRVYEVLSATNPATFTRHTNALAATPPVNTYSLPLNVVTSGFFRVRAALP